MIIIIIYSIIRGGINFGVVLFFASKMIKFDKRTSHWTIENCLEINPNNPITKLPKVDIKFPVMDENILLWDTWHLEDYHRKPVSVNGWHIIFCLCTTIEHREEDIVDRWKNRNATAFIGYFYSRDGSNWEYGGRVLSPSCDIRPYEWSGCTLLDDDRGNLTVYYTSTSDYEQIPAFVKGKIETSDEGVTFKGLDKTVEMLHPDGFHAATPVQNPFASFRDSSPFVDPKDGKTYLLYGIDCPWTRGEFDVDDNSKGNLPPSELAVGNKWATGGIGISHAVHGDFTKLVQLPPLLSAFGACVQTERPKLIYHNKKYYLFFITHHDMFAEGIDGADGLYCMVSDSLFGKYEPVNGSGQLLLNDPSSNMSGYSWDAVLAGDRWFAPYFIDHVPADDGTFRIGGTLGDTPEFTLDGTEGSFIGTVGYGFYPVDYDVTLR